jgi:uncharacterized protein YjeT (DUF2065 family)
MAIFICAVGLMMIFEGIPYFCFPTQLKEYAAKLTELPNGTLRTIGFIIMIIGLGVAYIGKSMFTP